MDKTQLTALQLSSLAEKVVGICQAAGKEILEVYEQDGQMDIDTKADQSPVTKADIRANAVIESLLQQLPYTFPIMTEESAMCPYEERCLWRQYWLVDPLDGTKEFIRKSGEFTVNIALVEDGEAVLGVVHVPTLNESYIGIVGQGAKKRTEKGEETIHCRQIKKEGALNVVASSQHRNADTETFIEQLKQDFSPLQFSAKGSSLKFCLLAEGLADIYPRMAPTCEWDTAAAHAVLKAAGGQIVDLAGQALRYNTKSEILNPSFVAYGDSHFPWANYILQNS